VPGPSRLPGISAIMTQRLSMLSSRPRRSLRPGGGRPRRRPLAIDLFAGAGGLTLGLGFSHGFALGIPANLLYAAELGDAPRRKLYPYYVRGFTQVLQRPAVLVAALDSKCEDYRNRGLSLHDVGFLAILEVGGLGTKQVDEALRLMRGNASRPAVVDALAADLE
jgi:hypothetical protein